MTKSKSSKYWFHLGLIGVLISAPNATIIKYSIAEINPLLFNAVRFMLIFIVMLPAFVLMVRRLNRSNLRPAVMSGIYLSLATIVYVIAIKLSQASYVSIITLITPITFVLLAVKITGERVSPRSVAGITLAAIGAMLIVILPIAIKQDGDLNFNPWATVLALLNTIFFPLAIINLKKANESGLSIYGLMGLTSLIVGISNGLIYLVQDGQSFSISAQAWSGIIYSGLVVACIGRIINVISYEHIGSALTSAIGYLEIFLAILLPVAILNEKLSPELILGGVLILLGVYIVEHHKSSHHKHYHVFRHH